MNRLALKISEILARYLQKPSPNYCPVDVGDPERLRRTLQPGDVLLVEGNLRISVAIKYLTQSTWSHAALYVGDALPPGPDGAPGELIEADVSAGVIAVPLSKYAGLSTRVCRPVGLSADERQQVVDFMVASLGKQYDLRNVIDLLRFLLPTPPVPVCWRRHLLALGSGDPTRAICSTLIAQAFQSIRYPILPMVETRCVADAAGVAYLEREILHIRHHSLFTPRDFDLSPYFAVVKPHIEAGFDHRQLLWADRQAPAEHDVAPAPAVQTGSSG